MTFRQWATVRPVTEAPFLSPIPFTPATGYGKGPSPVSIDIFQLVINERWLCTLSDGVHGSWPIVPCGHCPLPRTVHRVTWLVASLSPGAAPLRLTDSPESNHYVPKHARSFQSNYGPKWGVICFDGAVAQAIFTWCGSSSHRQRDQRIVKERGAGHTVARPSRGHSRSSSGISTPESPSLAFPRSLRQGSCVIRPIGRYFTKHQRRQESP